jgi:shikimate dehydrogenase
LSIDGQTQLVGIIGYPVSHSLSPEMHNAGFTYAGLNWRYVPLPVRPEHLREGLRGIAALGFRGLNVTVPYKVDVIPLMDSITEAVTVVGAVNTIRVDRVTGMLEGLNTDMTGFLVDLASNRVMVGKDTRVVVLGAGGAARAMGAGLVRSGARVIFANRTKARAESVVSFLKSSWASSNTEAIEMSDFAEAVKDATLIVNTTPLGMWPDVESSPWMEGVPFPKGAIVYDSVYRPRKTKLMRDAEAAGLRTISGIGMLVHQGAAAFEIWTGKRAPVDVMRIVVEQRLMEMDAKVEPAPASLAQPHTAQAPTQPAPTQSAPTQSAPIQSSLTQPAPASTPQPTPQPTPQTTPQSAPQTPIQVQAPAPTQTASQPASAQPAPTQTTPTQATSAPSLQTPAQSTPAQTAPAQTTPTQTTSAPVPAPETRSQTTPQTTTPQTSTQEPKK